MSKTILLTSLTRTFKPIPECDRIFECTKNGKYQYAGRLIPLSELWFIVFPRNPKKFEEIQHGMHTDIIVLEKCELGGEPVTDILEFIDAARKEARGNRDICFRTHTTPYVVTDDDPRIEYIPPPLSPVRHLANLPDEIYLATKLPREIDQYIAEKMIQLPDRDHKKILYFGHVIGIHIFVEIDDVSGNFVVRHYTGTDNTRHDMLQTYVDVSGGNIKSYVELDNNESIMFNRRTVIKAISIQAFLGDVFDFDHITNIKIVQSSDIGNTSANMEKKAKSMYSFLGEENDDEDDIGFLNMGNLDYTKSAAEACQDNFGNFGLF